MKKQLFFLTVIMAMGIGLQAQPTSITWQGKLLDADGNAITDPALEMTFAIFDAAAGGSKLWPPAEHVLKTVDVNQGLYSLQLGTGVGDDIAFSVAMVENEAPWIEVSVDGETLPRTPITNVPFALISNELSAAGWETPGEIGKATPNTGKFSSLETGTIKITEGASEGKVLSADAAGTGSWKTLTPSDIGAATAIHTHDLATTTTAGFMSAADKLKLNGLQNEMPADAATGDMAYYYGTSWKKVEAPDENNMVLTFCYGKPVWTSVGDCPPAELGDFAYGGVVFYIFQPGDPGYVEGEQHGLVAAVSDQSSGAKWGCWGTTIGGTGTGIGSGAPNTAAIVGGCGEVGIAARICNDLDLNGYSDWFLPSKDELNRMYQNRSTINATAVAHGGSNFASTHYWSSSESASDTAHCQDFSNGWQVLGSKNNSLRVRAIRTF